MRDVCEIQYKRPIRKYNASGGSEDMYEHARVSRARARPRARDVHSNQYIKSD